MDGSLVFGNGHLTWEWEHGLRSYLHPALFAILFKILKFVNLDTPFLVTIGMYVEILQIYTHRIFLSAMSLRSHF